MWSSKIIVRITLILARYVTGKAAAMGHTLLQKFLSEGLGSALVIFIGESILANNLLPNTKGHNLGFGWIAMGFGSAIFIGTMSEIRF